MFLKNESEFQLHFFKHHKKYLTYQLSIEIFFAPYKYFHCYNIFMQFPIKYKSPAWHRELP